MNAVGDFGLATSSLAAVDPSEMTLQASSLDADMTQGKNHVFLSFQYLALNCFTDVGTTLYIAPEIRSRGGHKNHSKADMYSLGVRTSRLPHTVLAEMRVDRILRDELPTPDYVGEGRSD